ncbi:hypothetical protein O0L34_g18644 [Tuta absoluta]|nr:hypothetical protein O0L34_g18644 [Tuta absoluta]
MDVGSDSSLKFRKRNKFQKNIYTGVPTIEYDEDRNEKPWQRVPSSLLLLLLGVYLLFAYLTQLIEDDMPRVVKDLDVERMDSKTFSEEAAWRYLNIILGDQPRVSGTAYHLQKTRDLKNLVDDVANQGNLPVQTDWQFADGDYWIDFAPAYVNVYQNVSNIIARLEGERNTSLLVNCHYDSVPYAMGASDDGVFCAVMMEVFSRLARRGLRFKHNIIFLWNGAEENPLQGSHAFLKHPWAKGIVNVINLDAAGMNGKPLVFQVSDPRLLAAYRRVVSRPGGQSVGEFMFKSGIIPSDTDFRIWRDFGHFHGLDIAFVKWSHVYHTRYDHPDMIRTGVIQNAGNTLLSLVAEVADMEELDTQVEPIAAVYYDYLYWFMITYSYGAAIAIDLLVAIFGLASVGYFVWLVGPRMSSVSELLFSVLGRLASMVAGILVCIVLVPLMTATTIQLRYLSEPWVVVPHYWLPYVMGAVGASQFYDAWRTKKNGLNRSIRTLQAQAASRLILSFVLLLLTCIPSLNTIR